MTVATDWDGTLVDSRTQEWLPGALEALKRLLRDGHRVIVHTCRANWPEGLASIEAKLQQAGVVGAHVWTSAGKPNAHLYVDNLGLRFDGDWPTIIRLVNESLPISARVGVSQRIGAPRPRNLPTAVVYERVPATMRFPKWPGGLN